MVYPKSTDTENRDIYFLKVFIIKIFGKKPLKNQQSAYRSNAINHRSYLVAASVRYWKR